MTTKQDAINELRKLAQGIPYVDTRVAITGKLAGDGTVGADITEGLDRPYVWVRFTETGEAFRAVNNRVKNLPNMKVVIARRTAKSEWAITGLEDSISASIEGEISPSLSVPDTIGDLEVSSVNPERFKYLQMYIVGGYTIGVRPGIYQKTDGTWEAFVGGTIDLTASIPSTSGMKKAILIGIDYTTGLLTSYAGSEVSALTPPRRDKLFDYEDYATLLNNATADVYWVGGVGILESETAITNHRRFTSLQWVEQGGGGSSTDEKVKVSVDDTTAAYLDTKIVAGSFISVDVLDPASNESLEINWLGASLDDLGDVNAPTPNDNDVLQFNSGTGDWEPSALPADSDELVAISANDTTPDYLVNKLIAGSAKITVTEVNDGGNEDLEVDLGSVALNDLSDVSTAGATAGDIFTKGGSSYEFVDPLEFSVLDFQDYFLAGGRLSLSSSVAVPTSDITAATTVYYLPYQHDYLALYNTYPGEVAIYSITGGLSLSLSGYTANTYYDIFAYDGSGSANLESVAWTNATTRATALAFDSRIGYYKNGDRTRRYLGSIKITGTTGQCEDSEDARFCWSYHNQVVRYAYKAIGSSHGYSTNTYRAFDNDTTNKVEIMRGLAEEPLQVSLTGGLSATSGISTMAVGEDSSTPSTVISALQNANAGQTLYSAYQAHPATLGYHEYYVVERSNGSGDFISYRLTIMFRG